MPGVKAPETKAELLAQTIKIMREHGIRPRKRLSQNFMVDPRVARTVISNLTWTGTEEVVEVGAGIGNLTAYLASVARRVIAIEIDKRLARILQHRLGNFDNVEILVGDYLKMRVPKADYLVANTPYHISSNVLFKALKEGYKSMIMAFQKEFALRLLAKPGTSNYGRLTVMAQLLSEVKMLRVFKPSAFYPPPKVETAIVKIEPKPIRASLPLLEGLVRAIFTQKNKLAYKPLSSYLSGLNMRLEDLERVAPEVVERIRKVKVRDLGPEEIVKLAEAIQVARRPRRTS